MTLRQLFYEWIKKNIKQLEGISRIEKIIFDEKAYSKNDLERGQVLHWRGLYSHYSVIIKNLGIDPRYSGYGAKYKCIDPRSLRQHIINAVSIILDSEESYHTQYYYIDKEKLSSEIVDLLFDKSEKLRLQEVEKKRKAEEEKNRLIEKGKELFKKYIPSEAKALIVACKEIDECDLQTDYFSTRTEGTVILGWSKHTKDLFSEMRKHAHKLEETKHLSENNPNFEHREKYSMGAGYYLKASDRYDTGWKIKKERKWNDWSDGLYISIAKRNLFE